MSVKDGSYVVIPAFAVNQLHLKGSELLVFSIINGFSQDNASWFKGSRAYLADWCGCSKGTVDNALLKLVSKGLVEKRKRIENGVTLCDYRVAQDFLPQPKNCATPPQNLGGGTTKIEAGGSPKIMTHSIGVDNIEENSREMEGAQRTRFTPPTPQEVADYAAEKGLALDADRFCDHYTANGWKVGGRSPMRDWRAAVRNWCRNYSDWAKPLHASEARKETEYDGDF